ncbi:MAG: hypothetical protein OXC19_23635 [Bryobacterales bacterium]|nr:hypothetical protein [Bryobacterales bacterium]
MNYTKQTVAVGIGLLALSVTALAQRGPANSGRGNIAEAAVEEFGLTEEQVEQIREIRRERPDRGQSREEFTAWREGQQEKIQALLTDEQTGQIAELTAARDRMRAYAGAAALGLVQPGGGNRGFGAWQGRARQGDSRSRSRSSRRGPSRGARDDRRDSRSSRRGSSRGGRGDRGRGRR